MRSAPNTSNRPRVSSLHYGGFREGLRTTKLKERNASTYYLLLKNLLPYPDGLRARKGYKAKYALPSPFVSALNGNLSGFTVQYVTTEAGLYNCNDVPVLERADITSGLWQSCQIANTAGAFVCAVNGTNRIAVIDVANGFRLTGEGSLPDLEYPTTVPNFTHIVGFKGRLWLVGQNSLDLYYLNVGAVTAELELFSVGSVASSGGTLAGLATWTVDAGIGVDDHLLAITTEGQLLVYKGVDPSSAESFSLVGQYQTAPPLGLNPFLTYSGDTLILTTAGIVSVKSLLSTSVYERDLYMTDSFKDIFQAQTAITSHLKGWSMLSVPEEGLLLVNAPTLNPERSIQFAFDSLTQSWSTFTGWNFQQFAWTSRGVQAYSSTEICEVFSGFTDKGFPIPVELITSYAAFGQPAARKRITLCRPRLETAGSADGTLVYLTDMADPDRPNPLSFTSLTSLWDLAIWDSSLWSGRPTLAEWQPIIGNIGFYLALWFRLDITEDFVWRGADIYYESGAML